ncbi:hypothetical protein C8R46DRAFT_1000638 [Mycena filopes]|nr:hypothetical protein C8R46DRAFT_1000638 [Mycena filopes]
MSESTDAPPAKRPRTEATHSEDSLTRLTRSEVWYDDGSVVLQAETILFRVHWTVLASQSSFFRDMRDLPQPADQPCIEGCPVVELHDSSDDVKHLLVALYNQLLFSDKYLRLAFLAGVIRLGRKYVFKKLLSAAVQRVLSENPMALEEYDALQKGTKYTSKIVADSPAGLMAIVNLAREHNLFTVLPCALLRVVIFHDMQTILEGLPQTDGRNLKLSVVDQQICLLAEKKLNKAQWDHDPLWSWLSSDQSSDHCTQDDCVAGKKQLFRTLINTSLIPFRMPASVIVCFSCHFHYATILREARKKLWDDLPDFFGLPPWNELKNDIDI